MKVGIVSQFGNVNFGNKLQNYALQQCLLKYADTVITIKNKPKAKNAVDYLQRFTSLAESEWLNRLCGKHRKATFLQFHNRYIRDSKTSYRLDTDEMTLKKQDRCDRYCTGSDQVWIPNSSITGPIHYLTFAEREQTFSYAASFGVECIAPEDEEFVRRGLQHIKYISVREDAGKRIVEQLTGRTDAQVLVDPTMLLTTGEWDAVASAPKKPLPKKYLLTYFLGTVSSERAKAIRGKAKELGCELVELMDPNSPFYAIGPGEFVYLIKNAAYVCTDSFHGSVFAFLYGRPLAIMSRQGGKENMSSRLETLASKFQLQDRVIADDSLAELSEQVDYTAGYGVLEEERKKSKTFFDMVFREAGKA